MGVFQFYDLVVEGKEGEEIVYGEVWLHKPKGGEGEEIAYGVGVRKRV